MPAHRVPALCVEIDGFVERGYESRYHRGGSFLGGGHGMGPQLALERFVPGAIETKTTAMAGLGEEHSDDEQILFWSE